MDLLLTRALTTDELASFPTMPDDAVLGRVLTLAVNEFREMDRLWNLLDGRHGRVSFFDDFWMDRADVRDALSLVAAELRGTRTSAWSRLKEVLDTARAGRCWIVALRD